MMAVLLVAFLVGVPLAALALAALPAVILVAVAVSGGSPPAEG